MSYDLLAWNAWARNATPDEIAEKLTQQQAEVARLRSVCRVASRAIADDIRNAAIDVVASKKLVLLAEDLRDNGKEPTDG